MDQFISALGRRDHALLLDCRDLNYRPVPLPPNAQIVVCDSHTERRLAGSAYNQRREECGEAVRIFKQWYPKITALRDVSVEQLKQHEASLPEPVRARARHVITENDRAVRSAAALEAGDVAAFGQMMNESHASLRDDYEVSIPAMDLLVAAAQQVPGCYGSRLTGAGFGGCTVSLVEQSAVERFKQDVAAAYRQGTGRDTTIYVCRASDGVGRAVPEA
jgi:galactokinase